jgi:hypothetical protein
VTSSSKFIVTLSAKDLNPCMIIDLKNIIYLNLNYYTKS